MIQTENYGLYKIEHSDDILSSIDAINLNMEKIDENLTEIDTMIGDVETILETLTAGSGVE